MVKPQKIVIFGLGKTYIDLKDLINKKYEVIGVTDNKVSLEANYMPVSDALSLGSNILICTSRYYEAIKFELIYKWSISEERILDRDTLDDLEKEMDAGVYRENIEKFKCDRDKYIEIYRRQKRTDNFAISEHSFMRPMLGQHRGEAGNIEWTNLWFDLWGGGG